MDLIGGMGFDLDWSCGMYVPVCVIIIDGVLLMLFQTSVKLMRVTKSTLAVLLV